MKCMEIMILETDGCYNEKIRILFGKNSESQLFKTSKIIKIRFETRENDAKQI